MKSRLQRIADLSLMAFMLLFAATGVTFAQEQDRDADKTAVPAPAAKVTSRKDQTKKTPDMNKKEEEKKGGITSDTFSGLKFRSLGPAMASGRVMSIAVNPKNKFEYYVGVASGGVWKTVNDGTTWTPVFGGEGSFSIGWVALDPNDASVVWAGTGESNSQRSVDYGVEFTGRMMGERVGRI